MAWTELTRFQHAEVGDWYASDLTDSEWALVKPLMPVTVASVLSSLTCRTPLRRPELCGPAFGGAAA